MAVNSADMHVGIPVKETRSGASGACIQITGSRKADKTNGQTVTYTSMTVEFQNLRYL